MAVAVVVGPAVKVGEDDEVPVEDQDELAELLPPSPPAHDPKCFRYCQCAEYHNCYLGYWETLPLGVVVLYSGPNMMNIQHATTLVYSTRSLE